MVSALIQATQDIKATVAFDMSLRFSAFRPDHHGC
jgi:hypothetical protein